MHDDAGYAREALAAGASGYVLKDAAQRQLVDAVHAVAAGRSYLDPGLGARVLGTAPPARARARATRRDGLHVRGTPGSTGSPGAGGMGIVYRATDLSFGRRSPSS